MDCWNGDIVIVLGNDLLTGLWGWVRGQCWMVYYVHVSSCWLVMQVFRRWSVFHICCCWFAQQPTTGVQMIFEFILSPVTICSKSNNCPSFTLTKMRDVYHSCLAMWKQTILANTTALPFKTVLLPVGAASELSIYAFHISNDCTINRSKEICRYIIYNGRY